MTNDKEELAVLIVKKKAQIENHERILRDNGTSRWYDQSKRYLQGLKDELQSMEEELLA